MSSRFSYAMENAHPVAERRMRALATLYDNPTREALERTGVGEGWQCLEVGGGGGSVARWLAERVGTSGSVLCTDIDTRYLGDAAGGSLRVVRHDIVSDPLPAGEFDLIHARLVLNFLAERGAVLDKLVAALKPGGWIVLEDFDLGTLRADPIANEAELTLATALALRAHMRANGAEDDFFGRRLYSELKSRGLRDLNADARAELWDRTNDGALLQGVNFDQLGPELVARGLVTAEQVAADRARLAGDDYLAPSPLMWTVSARK